MIVRHIKILVGSLALTLVTACAALTDTSPTVTYQSAGEPVTCLRVKDIQSMTPVDEQTVIINTGPSRYYRTEVTPGCKDAARLQRRLEYDVFSGSLCRGETIKVVDNTDGITTGFCQLGLFEPVTRVRPDQIASASD